MNTKQNEEQKKLDDFAKQFKITDEKLAKLLYQYRTNDWGYTGSTEDIELSGNTIRVRTFQSGDKYVERHFKRKVKNQKTGEISTKISVTLEKMDDEWFKKMQRMIDAEKI